MIGREQSLAAAVDMIKAGVSVDVVGGRGSGRSAFLHAIRDRLIDDEWTVVMIRGIASLRAHSLAALHLAGIGTSGGQRVNISLHESAEALRDAVRAPRSVLFLDDWDDLDESSWGVAEAIRRSSGVPIVLCRLQGLRARHTPTGLAASTYEPSYVIDMTPLRFEEMEKVLESYLDAPIEVGTMSRVFAKSGGNIGLALSLVDASVREGRMSLRGDREWVATRDLWSNGLRAVLEAHLENLDDSTRDALEIIATVGVADIDTVGKLVDWGTLELLEERRMITFVPSGDRQLVTVVPPLLVEFFRHEPLTARRTRLTGMITERLGAADPTSAILAERETRHAPSGEQAALFVRLLQERARARRIVAGAEWQANPSPATAIRYVRALIHTHTATVAESVKDVLERTDADLGDMASRAEFIMLRAQWTAYVDDDLDGALADLESSARSLGVYGRILDAAQVRLLTNLRAIPDDFATRLEVDDALPPAVKLALFEAQMLVLVSSGRFADTRRVYTLVDALDWQHQSYVPRVLLGLALLGEGRHEAAAEVFTRGFEEAHGYLDIDAVRAFGAAASLRHIFAGDYAAVDEMIETLFAAGEPAPFPPGIQLSVLTIAAVVEIRRGQIATGERLAAEVEAMRTPDGPLPAQTKEWARVQLLAFDGQTDAAADALWESSMRLWERGARFAAATGLVSALELALDPDRVEVARQLVAEIPEARGIAAHLRFVTALLDHDVEAMSNIVDVLHGYGLTGLALSACEHLATWALDADDEDAAAAAAQRGAALRAEYPGRSIDTARFGASAIVLTDREKEVGRLAAEGLSNQEIATRLVLSTRTVESHMHRIMRKLDVTNRRGLRRRLEALS